MDRRTFLARAGTTAGLAGLAGCSSVPGFGSDAGSLGVVFQAPAETVDVNTWYAADQVVTDGYGRRISPEVVAGVDTAVNTVRSGNGDLARGSLTAAATLADQNLDFRFVAAPIRQTDYVLVAREGIDSVEAIVEQDATIGMFAPTSLEAVQTAALLLEEGVIDSADELNFQQVGSSGTRMAAIREGTIDVSPQHFSQWLALQETDAKLTSLATFGKRLDSWIQETYIVPSGTIEEKRGPLVDFLAAQLVANDRLYGDFERYRGLVEQYVEGGGPSEERLRRTYEFLTDIEVWPAGGGLARENVDYMLDLSNRLGLTEERIPTDEAMARGPLEEAIEVVEGERTATGN